MLKTFLALAAGCGVTVLLTALLSTLLGWLTPSWAGAQKPSAGYRFVNLGWTFLAAAAGGYATAWMAAANPLVHVLVLGIVLLAVSALSTMQARGTQPVVYALALVAIAPLGVLAGGLVRLRVLGIL